jgi:hypothetical protein
MKNAQFSFNEQTVGKYRKIRLLETEVHTERGSDEFVQIMIPKSMFEAQLQEDGTEKAGFAWIGQKRTKDGVEKTVGVPMGNYYVKLTVSPITERKDETELFASWE